jgi:PAS domain S-box-containing protein
VGEEKLELDIEHKTMQTHILNDEQIEEYLDEKDYREIIDNKDDEFAIVNIDREFKFLTDNIQKVHGYDFSEIEGLNVLTFLHPKDLPEFTNILMEYNKDPKLTENIGPIRVKTKNGRFISYLITLIPLFNEDSERIATAVVLKDVSKPLGGETDENEVENTEEQEGIIE